MIKVGIIGYGKMGRIRAAAIAGDCRGKVSAVYDPLADPAANGLPRAESPEAVIDNPEIAAIFVCTPNGLIKDLVVQALHAGKHVFAEKPPGISIAQVEEMRDALAQNPGAKLKFGFNHRYHDAIMVAKERIDSGQYGDILWLRGRYGKSVDENFKNTWRAQREMAGGGILLDQGIHMLDLFVHLVGDFEEVKGFCNNQYWGLNIEDNVFAMLRNAKGQTASLHSTMTQWRHLFSLEIFLQKGYMVINGILSASGAYLHQGGEELTIALNRTPAPMARHTQEERLNFKEDMSFQREVGEFLDCIINDRPIIQGTIEDAHLLMTLIEKIYADDQIP